MSIRNETEISGSVANFHGATESRSAFVECGARDSETGWKCLVPLVGFIVSVVVFAILVWGLIEIQSHINSWVSYLWCVVGLSIPLLFSARCLRVFLARLNLLSRKDSNAAMICAVEVCINNETVLTVRSWWPVRLDREAVEKHGVRVATSSARRWLAENGKASRIRFDEDIAVGLCRDYICDSECAGPRHCSVCLDDIDADCCVKMKNCGHTFHSDCLSSWFSQSSKLVCPMCRSDHHSLVPLPVILEHTVKEDPSISILTVSVEAGILNL